MGGPPKRGRPTTLPPVLEERIKSALRRAGHPCTITDIRPRIAGARPPNATLRAALANLLEGGEMSGFALAPSAGIETGLGEVPRQAEPEAAGQ
jgi:hypothetical protein